MRFLLYDTALNGEYTWVLLQKQYPVNMSLFKGTRDERLYDVAPHVFQVDAHVPEKISGPLVSLQNKVVMVTHSHLEELVKHLQQFIYKQVNGREHYFRFWDARVLKPYLEECSTAQAARLFGPVEAFLLKEEHQQQAMQYRLKGTTLQALPLDATYLFEETTPVQPAAPQTGTGVQQNRQKPGRSFFIRE